MKHLKYKCLLLLMAVLCSIAARGAMTKTVYVSSAGTLSQFISSAERYSIEELKLTGTINGSDIRILRDMAGCDYQGKRTDGKLKVLDLSGATIVSGGDNYLETDRINLLNGSISFGYSKYGTDNNQISAYMFAGCNLTSINLPKSLTHIGNLTFHYCTQLSSVAIPASVISISGNPFEGCSLQSISVESGNKVYDSRNNCNALIESSSNKLILGCASTIIPNDIVTIGTFAFYTYNMESIVIPNGVKNIESYAFANTRLSSVTIPSSVEFIDNSAFARCYYLKDVVLSEGLSSLGDGVFENCSHLQAISLPSSLTSIGNYVFRSCSQLKSLSIPRNVKTIGWQIVASCPNLTSLSVEAANKKYDSRDNCNAIIETATNKLVTGCNNTIIPSSIYVIGDYAFAGCSNITSITLPNRLSKLGYSPFQQCNALGEIRCMGSFPPLSSSTMLLNSYNGVTLYVPKGLKDVYAQAQAWNNFTDIREMEDVEAEELDIKPNDEFVEDGIRYQVNEDWNSVSVIGYTDELPTNLKIASSVKEGRFSVSGVNNNAFSECSALKSVTIPETVRTIGYYAFQKCSNLEEVSILGDIESLNFSVFSDCSLLKTVNLPSTLTEIPSGFFYNCRSLTSLSFLPSSLKTIGGSAFYGCNGLKSAEFPDGLESIGHQAFDFCYNLTSAKLPKGLKKIENGVFRGCRNLTSLVVDEDNPYFDSRDNCNAVIETNTNSLVSGCRNTSIPASVTAINDYAFWYCYNLESVIINSGISKIGKNVFDGCSSLKSIAVDEDNNYFDSRNNCNAIIEKSSKTLIYGCSSTLMPSGIEAIGDNAFNGVSLNQSDVVIPEGVKSIGFCAFASSGMKSVKLPNSLETIGAYAFERCNFTSIVLPANVKDLSYDVFRNCNQLTDIYCLSLTVPEIGSNAFGVAASKTIHVPASALEQYQELWQSNGYKEIVAIDETVPSSLIYRYDNSTMTATVTGLEDKDATEVVIPATVTQNDKTYTVKTIANSAFSNCTELTEISLPPTLETIQYSPFSYCTSLKSIVIPQSVVEMNYGTFMGCTSLTSIVVEEGNPKYDSRNNCNAVIETAKNILQSGCNSTVIPDGVETINVRAFDGMTGLKSLYIPKSVKNVYSAFDGCSSLESIVVDKENTTFDSRNNCNAIINTAKNELVLGCKTTVIPNDVVSIGYTAFQHSGITSITIPASVTQIRDYTFAGSNIYNIVVEEGNPVFDSRDNCNAIIKTATNTLFWGGPNTVIPASVTTIGSYSYRGCTELKSIDIPENVTTIEYGAFEGSGLTTLTIPATVTKPGFAICNGCASLTDIYLYAKTVPDEHIIMENPYAENITLHVPASALEQYQEQWQDDGYKEIVAIDESVPGVLRYSYNTSTMTATVTGLENEDATEVVIPSNVMQNGQTYTVTAIYSDAFSNCNELTSVTMPSTITKIEYYAFSGCKRLESVSLSSGLKEIGFYAFMDCSKLKNISLPSGLEKIDFYAFQNCTSLQEVVIPASLIDISHSVFSGCKNLSNVVIEEGNLKELGSSTFDGCSDLKNITLPLGLETIGSSAFQNCTSLEKIVIPASVTNISSGVFTGCNNLSSIVVEEGNSVYDSRNNCNAIIATEKNELIQGCQSTVIPNGVISIGQNAFMGIDNLKTIQIPNTVQTLQNNCFRDCKGLTSINIPSSVKELNYSCFYGCSALVSITVDNANTVFDSRNNCNAIIETAKNELIKGCNNTKIPDEIVTISSCAFEGCTELTSIGLPNGLVEIGSSAFSGCTNLETISFPSTLTTIESSAFYGCSSLKSLVIPRSVQIIGDWAFYGCGALTSIVVEEGNENYDSRDNCNAIISKRNNALVKGCDITVFPADIRVIDDGAFKDCKGLQAVDIPEGVTSIGSRAFGGCINLVTAIIPPSVKGVGSYFDGGLFSLFDGCDNLKDVYVYTEEQICYYDYNLPTTLKNVTCHVPSSKVEEYQGQYGNYVKAFVALEEIKPDDGIISYYYNEKAKTATVIGILADAEKPSFLNIPAAITKNGVEYAVTSICYSGYEELTSVRIPSSVKTISRTSFGNAVNLQKIIIDDLYAWCNIDFDYNNVLRIAGHLYSDENTEIKELIIPEGVNSLKDYVFNGCKGITSVKIPGSVTSIGNYAFQDCSNLVNVSISEGLLSINYYAFQGCTNLTTINIPSSVTTVNLFSFSNCTSLPIVNGIRYADTYLVEAVEKSWSTYTIKSGTKFIGYEAFSNCSNLSSMFIPYGVKKIDSWMFYNCSSLTSVSLPSSIETISQLFVNTYNVNNVEIRGDISEVVGRSYPFSNVGTAEMPATLVVPLWALDKYQALTDAMGRIGGGYFNLVGSDAETFVYEYNDEALTATIVGLEEGVDEVYDLRIPATTQYNGKTYTVTGFNYSGYNEMESVYVPRTITAFGKSAFNKSTSLKKVIVEDLASWVGISFYTSDSNPLRYAGHLYSDAETEITQLEIPSSVTSINRYAFYGCVGLQSVDIPKSVTNIDISAFANCTGLKEIVIPASVASMGSSVFNGCTGLTDIYCYAKQVPSGGKGLVGDRYKEVTLHVPASALDDYKSNTYWGEIVNIVPMEEGPAEVKYNFVEYFIGTDPGLGYAKFVKVEPDENGAVEFNIPATELNFGLNTVGIRLVSYYDDGKPYYSPTTLHTVYRYHAEDAQTVGVEYFLNTDPGIGKAKCIIASSDSLSFDIPREQMKEGINVLGLRAISWNSETDYCYGATQYRYIYCPAANGNRDIERIEYFWDVDPGKGNGMAIDFYMVNDSAVVDCNIDYSGLSGTHILNIRALSHGVWSTLYQQAVVLVALTPLSGDLSLDPANVENVEQGRFSLLSSLLGALSTRGFTVGVNVNVADNTYNFIVSEESLLFIQKLYGLLVEKNFYLSMKAPKEAVFNFIMPEEFIYIHEKDIPQIVAAVQAMFSHILTENISILINGQVYQYDGFQVEPNDLMALKNMYNRLGGENWTVKKWSFKSNGRDKDELPGVTFSEEGRVREINLSNNGLVGELGSWELILPELRVLSLDRNRLTGDVAPFVSELTKLSSLDLCYNRLTEVSKPLPKNIGTLNLQSQFRIEDDVYGVYNLLEPFDSAVWEVKPIQAYISEKQTLSLPTILTYKHKEQNYSNSYGLYLYWHGIAETTSAWLQRYGESYEFKYTTNYDYAYPQDEQWLIAPSMGEAAHSAYPVKVHYMEGDANMSGYTDVLDVQHTLNYILSTVKKFNYSAANTYIDKQINVQDIVCTVNIVLDNELNTTASARSASAMPSEEPQGWLYTRNGQLQLMAAADVAAIDMELSGVKTSQVSLLLNHSQFQLIGRNTPTGSRYVIYSPTGQTIPAGEATALLKLSAQAEVVAAQAADIAAEEVRMALGEQPTGISQLMSSALKARFQGNSLVVTATTDVEHIALQLVTVGGATVYSTELPLLRRGETVFETAVAPGIYLLEMATKSGSRKMVKLMKK